jgi:hypothetical protein
MTKHFERTYDLDTEGAPLGPLTPAQMGRLTKALRADGRKEEHQTFGDTEVVSMSGDIGGVMRVTVRTSVGEPEEAVVDPEGEPDEGHDPDPEA